MNKELFRMQMLAGIITESQYKEMLDEDDISDTDKEALRKITAKEPIKHILSPKGIKFLITKVPNQEEYTVYRYSSNGELGPGWTDNSLEDAENKIYSGFYDSDYSPS